MESVEENTVIDLIKNEKLSCNEANEVLGGLYPGLRGLSSRSVRQRIWLKWLGLLLVR